MENLGINSGDFFVMLTTQSGGYTPLMTVIGQEEVMAKFETLEQAQGAAMQSELGGEFGFEVFEIGLGNLSTNHEIGGHYEEVERLGKDSAR